MNAFAPIRHQAPPDRHRFTAADVLAMVAAGVISPDARYEILDGEIIDMPSEGELHRDFKAILTRFFVRAITDDLLVAPDASMPLSPIEWPEPDLYIYEVGSGYNPIPPEAIRLVVEIADTSLGHDLSRKALTYARHGIGEYWVVDVQARQTHVLRRPGGDVYHEISAMPFDADLVPERISGICLRISDLPDLPQP